jgi:hypothetical protein
VKEWLGLRGSRLNGNYRSNWIKFRQNSTDHAVYAGGAEVVDGCAFGVVAGAAGGGVRLTFSTI